jgi:hypothetical protein
MHPNMTTLSALARSNPVKDWRLFYAKVTPHPS